MVPSFRWRILRLHQIIVSMLLIALVLVGGIGGYFFYAQSQETSALKASLNDDRAHIGSLQSELDEIRIQLNSTKDELNSTRNELAQARSSVAENPTTDELNKFLSMYGNANPAASYEDYLDLVFALKQRAVESHMRVAIVHLQFEGTTLAGITESKSMVILSAVLVGAQGPLEEVYFTPNQNTFYVSPEDCLLRSALGYAQYRIVRTIVYWF
jgi:hypothetical protein